jgi:hypothetical protein
MSARFKRYICFIWLLLTIAISPVKAQLLNDTAALRLVNKNINYIYNLQFSQAREIYARIKSSYPGHPITFLLKGITTYWENYPLLVNSPGRASFEDDMHEAIRLAEENKKTGFEAEYLLSDLCARGMLLMFYADNHLVMEVIPLTSGTYKYLMRSFDYTSASTDLYYFTGLYNYYRDEYPRVYPVYKPLALLFPPGNREKGLYELKTAAMFSVVLQAESAYLLSWIFQNFEYNFSSGLTYSRQLHEKYPSNYQYLAVYIKNLLLLKMYDEAEVQINDFPEDVGNRYFRAQLQIFKGILQEKKYRNYRLASQYYNKGISAFSYFGDYGNEYTAYGYYGLSRLSNFGGEKRDAEIYRKEATRLCEFKKINFD